MLWGEDGLEVRNRWPSSVRVDACAQDVSLTGWVAMLGLASFILLVAYGCVVAYRRLRGLPGSGAGEGEGYTLVVKSHAGVPPMHK